jgi:hypothetical protein
LPRTQRFLKLPHYLIYTFIDRQAFRRAFAPVGLVGYFLEDYGRDLAEERH